MILTLISFLQVTANVTPIPCLKTTLVAKSSATEILRIESQAARLRRQVQSPGFARGEASHAYVVAGLARYGARQCQQAIKDFHAAATTSSPTENKSYYAASALVLHGMPQRGLSLYKRELNAEVQQIAAESTSFNQETGPISLRVSLQGITTAERGSVTEALHTLEHYVQGSDLRPDSSPPYFAAVVNCWHGNSVAARANLLTAIDASASSSVHGGWFAFDNVSLDALRLIGRETLCTTHPLKR